MKSAPKILLPECYVLIEHLVIPEETPLAVSSIEDALEKLNLNDEQEKSKEKHEKDPEVRDGFKKKLNMNLKNKIYMKSNKNIVHIISDKF